MLATGRVIRARGADHAVAVASRGGARRPGNAREPGLAVDLRVEGGAEQVALLARRRRGRPAASASAPRLRADPGDQRRPDEVACTGAVEAVDVEVGLERVDLVAEGVAAHRDVEAAERQLPVDRALDLGRRAGSGRRRCRTRQPVGDRARAAAPASPKSRDSLSMTLDSPPGMTRPSSPVELARAAHGTALRPERGRTARCSRKSPCSARTPTVCGCHQPRSASRCGAGRSDTLMPTIASPSPRETSAITAGSS